MNHWLVKQEPSKYSWEDFVKDGKTHWDGVRNYQARNNLKAMKKGDQVLYYHSIIGKEVVGVAEVCRESYPDPTTDDERWVVVDLKPIETFKKPVTLDQVKVAKGLESVALIKQSRLSVMPLSAKEFNIIMKLGETRLP